VRAQQIGRYTNAKESGDVTDEDSGADNQAAADQRAGTKSFDRTGIKARQISVSCSEHCDAGFGPAGRFGIGATRMKCACPTEMIAGFGELQH
jgi:hypothetical protein